jgi:nucleoid DNA-binding protein
MTKSPNKVSLRALTIESLKQTRGGGREGRNPATGETIQIPAKTSLGGSTTTTTTTTTGT